MYSKPCLKRPLKRRLLNRFSRRILALCRSNVLLNGPVEHSAVRLTCIKLLHGFKTFVVSFEWPLKTGFTVVQCSG